MEHPHQKWRVHPTAELKKGTIMAPFFIRAEFQIGQSPHAAGFGLNLQGHVCFQKTLCLYKLLYAL